MRIAIVPARGGSKRIPKKNIIDFHGKPIISYVLETLKASKMFDAIHVSTDDQEIADVVRGLGFAVPFMRPSELADDFTPVNDVAKFVIDKFKQDGLSYGSYALVMPCSPLLEADDFKKACQHFESHGGLRPVLAVSKFPTPIEWALSDENGELVPSDETKFKMRSQDLKPAYFDTGTFSIQSADFQNRTGRFLKFELPAWRSVDIDTFEDLQFARKLFQLRDMK